jgi:Domain of unknown function (DUF4166)
VSQSQQAHQPRRLQPFSDLCDRGSRITAPRKTSRNLQRPHQDTRYRDLLPADAWARLPLAVRDRFMRHLRPGDIKVFTGAVVRTQLSPIGRVLALLLRPLNVLPAHQGATGPSHVVVTEGSDAASQIYTRHYGRSGGAAQIITTTKCFSSDGLVERLGFGLTMRLAISVEATPDAAPALVFRSTGYTWTAFGRSIALPGWLSPGAARIEHRDIDGRRFRFTLTLDHPRAGRLVEQIAEYVDAT